MRTIGIAIVGVLGIGCALLRGDGSPIVAEGDDFVITQDELDARAKDLLFAEETRGQPTRVYELRNRVLEEWLEERIVTREAERRGLEVDALLDAEAEPVTEEEVQAFFDANRSRMRDDVTLEDVTEPIRELLRERKRDAAIDGLVAAANVRVYLESPRLDVAAVGPALGPEDAPVTIVEFSDFQCPFCRKAAPTVKALRERYPEQVRIVYRHLPLESIHPRARAAAEAAACAAEQDLFWAYHDRIFEQPDAFSDEDLRAHAQAVGAELAPFEQCLESDTQQARIDADIAAAREAGISGTPAFVVNGVLLTGAQPIEAFERLIERELAAPPASP